MTTLVYPDRDTVISTDPRAVSTTTKLNAWRQPESVEVRRSSGNGLELHETSEYDASGRLRRQTRIQGRKTITTTNEYDVMNRLVSTTTDNVDVGGSTTSVTTTTVYDLPHHTITTTRPGGAVETVTIDSLGRTASTDLDPILSGPIDSELTYDVDDNLVASTNHKWASQLAYDIHGREIEVRNPDLTTTGTTYDAWDRATRVERFDKLGGSIGISTMDFTPAGRLESTSTKIDADQTRSTSFVWDGAGRTTGSATGDRASRQTFDVAGRMKSSKAGRGSASGVSDTFTASTIQSYDGPFASAISRSERNGTSVRLTLDHDTVGNTTSQTVGHLTWNQKFDESGNMVSSQSPARPESTFDYDARGSMTTETLEDLSTIEHQYGADGAATKYVDQTNEPTSTTNDAIGRPRVREYADGTSELFEWDGPRIQSITDRQGRKLAYAYYPGTNQLWRILDAAGLPLDEFSYDAAERTSRARSSVLGHHSCPCGPMQGETLAFHGSWRNRESDSKRLG